MDSSQERKLVKNLRKIGFYANECKHILKNFSEERTKQALHYYWWLSKFKTDRKYEKSYVYTLLHSFDLNKTYLDYQNYLKNKKSASKIAIVEKKKYTILDRKVGEDADIDHSPKNVLDFIRYAKKDQDS